MTARDNSSHHNFELAENDSKGVIAYFYGDLDATTAGPMLKELKTRLKGKDVATLTLDLGQVSYMDDFGALVIAELKRLVNNKGGDLKIENAVPRIKDLLVMLNVEAAGGPGRRGFEKQKEGLLVRLGDATLGQIFDTRYVFSFIGAVCLAIIHVCRHPRSLRRNDTFLYMQKTGVDALPILALISFQLGLILAFMSSLQLQHFGANVYVPSLVSIAMARELGPIMTAILVAGRSGSAFAAEIGTMKISEEVDALFTMGFEPVRFLVVPKIVASVIVVPLLTLFSEVFAIMGGLVAGVTVMDFTARAYVVKSIEALTLFDVWWGCLKAAVFAFLIAWIGCLRGFQVRGGAAAVGQATTSAVVSSLFLIILADSVFSVMLSYWG